MSSIVIKRLPAAVASGRFEIPEHVRQDLVGLRFSLSRMKDMEGSFPYTLILGGYLVSVSDVVDVLREEGKHEAAMCLSCLRGGYLSLSKDACEIAI